MSAAEIPAHELAEQAFLDRLRRRVRWQADVAYPQLVRDAQASWSVWELERRVAERGGGFPERLEEWRWHLRYLRFHATPAGSLPPGFDEYVRGAFAELL